MTDVPILDKGIDDWEWLKNEDCTNITKEDTNVNV